MSFEEMLEQKLREVVEPLHKEISELRAIIQSNHYKPSLSVQEAAKVAGVGRNKMYEWANHPDFPKIREGERGKIVIPTRPFLKWLEEYAPTLESA